MPQRRRTKGQALVEFALTATLIFFMLAAAVDLGLIFFTLQGLHNAAQEGATYGSRWLVNQSNTMALDTAGIRDRVRHESGTRGGIGYVNLLDLNSNGTPDVSPDTSAGSKESNPATGNPVINDYIVINALQDTDGDGDPLPENTVCPRLSGATTICFIQVIVSADYNMVFPLAPAFGSKIHLTSSYLMPMRSGFSQGGPPTGTPVTVTVTPGP